MKKKVAQDFKVWRMVDDILPSQNTTSWEGDGIYGEGLYLRPERLDVVSFDEEESTRWAVNTEFLIQLTNFVHLNDENTSDTWSDIYVAKPGNPLFEGKIQDFDLGELVISKGYEALIVTGEDVDGGNQVFIPKGVTLKNTAQLTHVVVFKKKKDAELVAKEVDSAVRKNRYGWIIEVSADKTSQLDDAMSSLPVYQIEIDEA